MILYDICVICGAEKEIKDLKRKIEEKNKIFKDERSEFLMEKPLFITGFIRNADPFMLYAIFSTMNNRIPEAKKITFRAIFRRFVPNGLNWKDISV